MTLSRSTPLSRGAGPKRRTRLRTFSDRRASDREARKAVVDAVFAAAGYRCQAVDLPHTCSEILDCHEIIPRSAWPSGYLEPSNCMAVCRSAHDWIGDHPMAAHRLGYHGFSYERPA